MFKSISGVCSGAGPDFRSSGTALVEWVSLIGSHGVNSCERHLVEFHSGGTHSCSDAASDHKDTTRHSAWLDAWMAQTSCPASFSGFKTPESRTKAVQDWIFCLLRPLRLHTCDKVPLPAVTRPVLVAASDASTFGAAHTFYSRAKQNYLREEVGQILES